MKCDVLTLDNKKVGSIDLADGVFGSQVRIDIMSRTVNWQLAKRRSGNHKTKNVSEIRGTTAKPWNQKGTGRARAGTLRATQFRGGARPYSGRLFGIITNFLGKSVKWPYDRLFQASKQTESLLY